ncbi:MAG: DUF4249 domain-containing protein [Bacteroidaceae bacterium]|nr:DUF4249 domain-containing protein [Bacteroidaceae bacterium]
MKKYSTIILSAAVLICACTKDIEYKGPDSERMLIVNSITRSGNIPLFRMSHSAFFLDSYYSGHNLNSDVTVNVDINGETRTATYDENCKAYSDGRAIHDGDIISVTASHPLYGTASATDTVPHAQNCLFSNYRKEYVPTQTISELFDDFISDFDDSSVDSVWVTELEIQGIDDKKDFYMLTIEPILTYYRYNDWTEQYDTFQTSLHYKIPSETKILLGQADGATAVLEETEADSQFEWGKTEFLFDDLHIKDGNKFSFDIMMEKPDTVEYIYTYSNEGHYEGADPYSITDKIKDEVVYSVTVKLYVLSDAYYYYHKSVNDYWDADDISFLSEPVTIIHNVKGGAGIVATYTSKTFQTEFKYKFK